MSSRFRTSCLGIAQLFAVAIFLSCTSCSGSRLWGQSREDLFARLEARDYGFFDEIDVSRYRQVLKLGSEAPFFIGRHLASAGRDEQARIMFEIGERESAAPFKLLCLEEMTRTGTPAERLDAVDRLLSWQNHLSPSGIRDMESLRIHLLLELELYGKIPGGLAAWQDANPLDESLVSLFTPLPAGENPLFYEIMNVRTAVYRKNYGIAWAGARALLEAGGIDSFGRTVLSDFGKAALYGSVDCPSDAAFLDRLAAGAENRDAQFLSAFYAGRLYARVSGIPAAGALKAKARERFVSAMSLAGTDTDYDSALWYLLELSGENGLDGLFADLERYAGTWKNDLWFTDLLDSLIVRLVDKRDWKRILALRTILGDRGDPEITARLAYIAARSGKLSAADRDAAFEIAFSRDHGSLYYRSLAADALSRPPGAPKPVQPLPKKPAGNLPDETAELLLRGYIDYKLPELVYPAAARLYPAVPADLAAYLGAALSASGHHDDAIRLVLLSLRSGNREATDEDLALVYPRPWHDEVAAAAMRFAVPEYLLYALIRSESYFQADVVSTAGAVGLTQLMGSTAADIAKKLGMTTFELTDPATNITFGAWYLSEMIRRMDGQVLPALFAYNAGISRVRAWQKTANGLSGDLFLESLPYAETREYGRKVLAAAVVYGYLYYQKTTGQVVREIF